MDKQTTLDPFVGDSLRIALAAILCLLVVESFRIQFGYLAVMTTHMVMNQVTTTTFQRGFERILGRAVGVFYGILLVVCFGGAKVLGITLEVLGMTAVFYFYFSGRLAYTFLNCGLYLASIVEIGYHLPTQVVAMGCDMLIAIAVGVVAADFVNWITRAEESLEIVPGGKPLWPIQGEWLSHSLMLVATVLITLFVTRLRGFPVSQSVISVMMISIVSDRQSLLVKGELRILGALFAGAWALVSNLILSRLPHFPLYVVLIFFGMFVASYVARAYPSIAYAGVQMGMALAIVLVVPPNEFGTLQPVELRMEGAAIGLFVSVIVSSLWPSFKEAPDVPAAAPSTR